jgi:predicted DNA-binding antitoxin AbrB/MazE fold protein
MMIFVDAIFEDGVFRPIQPDELPNLQRVHLTIEADVVEQEPSARVLAAWDAFCEALEAPPRILPELRQLLIEPGVFDLR